MKLNICYKEKLDNSLETALNKLPIELKNKIISFLDNHRYKSINEIRLHKNSYLCLIADSLNVLTNIFIDEKIIEESVESLCDGSVYAHFNTIREGYIAVGNGIRAGICGKASLENGEISGIYDITSINIRIPQLITNASSYLYNILKEENYRKSFIIYSEPGVGKTSILRDLVSKLSREAPPIRFSIIDSRDEIASVSATKINADVYISYPKGTAIELATRSMSPQLIICDEIGSMEEAKSVLEATASGVSIIATCHASSIEELNKKVILSSLFEKNIFDYAIGVSREYGKRSYNFTLTKLK